MAIHTSTKVIMQFFGKRKSEDLTREQTTSEFAGELKNLSTEERMMLANGALDCLIRDGVQGYNLGDTIAPPTN